MRFEFATANRIVFGEATVREAPAAAREMGTRALVVCGHSTARAEALLEGLKAEGLRCDLLAISGEPSVSDAREGAEQARQGQRDVVIGIGGGSALDAAKAIAALAANGGDPLDYLEVIGRGKPITKPSLPMIAIPTTAGTGTEVTRNAVLSSYKRKVKASLRSPYMLPRLAILDPELTYGLPPAETASTGLDALTQLIEPYVSARANAMTDPYCLDGIGRVRRALVSAYENGNDRAARADMVLASLFGGIALANAGLGAAHGFAAPIGGMFDAPHGAVCAALLPHVMEANIAALRKTGGLERYETVARILTGKATARAEEGAAWVREVCRKLAIPGLRAYGVEPEHAAELVEKASAASSMKANPVRLGNEELHRILSEAL